MFLYILTAFLFDKMFSHLVFRQTPFFLIPIVTTFTAFLPSSTWQLPLTSHRRNDCEYNETLVSHESTLTNRALLTTKSTWCSFSRASVAVNNLKRFHEKKKKGLKPRSLYLDHIMRKSTSSHSRRESHSRSHRDINVIKVPVFHIFKFQQ